jgi:hypothetical protein
VIKIDSRAAREIQPELLSGESIYWAGMPNPHIIFHSEDWQMIPFSLLWAGFAFFWEGDALGLWRNSHRFGHANVFMSLWGIPFVIIGIHMLWGRFFVDAWLKRRTYYAVTNRRVLVVQQRWRSKSHNMIYLQQIPRIVREGAECGTIWFGEKLPVLGSRGQRKRDSSRFSLDGVPIFADIDDVHSVHQLVLDLQSKIDPRPKSSDILTYNEQK